MKTELGKCKKLLDSGLSLVCVGDNKIPNFSWKERQTKPYTKEEFEKHYNYVNGIFKKNGEEIFSTNGIGIITGYNGLEVFDIDLKILPTLKEQQDFWAEYIGMLKDHIDDFDKKFVIYKTVNNGFHILYRCETIAGNLKVAKLKDHKEAIIETRGVGGYVFIYENQVSKNSYTEIKEISVLDREMLFGISEIYNYKETKDEVPKAVVNEHIHQVELTVWDDYNTNTSIFDVINDEFTTVKRLSDKIIIKRIGATSAHSGYIYSDSGCMYLFSTGTIYPHEKLISPFSAYTYKYHNGNYSESAKELYQKGFGTRVVAKVKELEERPKINPEHLQFPIDIFPKEIQNYIILCNETLDSSLDYMGCSMMWLMSVIIGNSLKVQVKNGWEETAVLWISVLGKAGIGKTPSIANIVFPLQKANNREIKKYVKHYDKYQAFMALDKKEKANTEEIKKPKKTQFIANDVTLEALVDLHEESKNAIGVFKDEIAGWFKDMNKYRAGSDLETWLSSWSGKSIMMNRKTAKSSFVEAPFIPVIGGIQPRILDGFYTEENKDNGFIDRMLLCLPDLIVEDYNEKEIDYKIIQWYSDYIVSFYDTVKNHITKYNNDDEIDPIISRFTTDAKDEWVRIFNSITKEQNSDEENEYMKSMLPKQKSYIPRFALILNTLSCFDKGLVIDELKLITKASLLGAEKLSKYFIAMAKKIKISSSEVGEYKKLIKSNDNKSNREKFIQLYTANNELNKNEVAELLGVSRTMIYKYIKEIEQKV